MCTAETSSGTPLGGNPRETHFGDRPQKSLKFGLGHLKAMNDGEREGRTSPALMDGFAGLEYEHTAQAFEEPMNVLEALDSDLTHDAVGMDPNGKGSHGITRQGGVCRPLQSAPGVSVRGVEDQMNRGRKHRTRSATRSNNQLEKPSWPSSAPNLWQHVTSETLNVTV